MKKLAIALTSLFILAIMYTSCKSHETCPAYGKVIKKANREVAS